MGSLGLRWLLCKLLISTVTVIDSHLSMGHYKVDVKHMLFKLLNFDLPDIHALKLITSPMRWCKECFNCGRCVLSGKE